jgi:hypothetical protein
MKRTVLMTILAMSLSLGASWANKPTGINKTEEHPRLTQPMQIDGEGTMATNDPAGQQIPVQSNAPGNADREKKPLLVAPGGGSCATCRQPFLSPLPQLRLLPVGIYWI